MGIAIPQVITPSRATGAQVIDGSLKFDKSKSHYLTRTPSASNRRTWTWSGWVKRTLTSDYPNLFTVDGTTGSNFFQFLFEVNDQLYVRTANNTNNLITTALFRDFSAWYHVVLAVDTTQATDSDRLKLYVNGSQITEFSTESYPTQNADLNVNTTNAHYIGRAKLTSYSPVLSSGQISQVYFIDGQQLGPENFGFTDPLTNTWRPKNYEGTFGTNGFYLPMDGNSPIGEDKSGITTLNDGTFWSKYVTISEGNTGTNYDEDASAWFDGDTSTSASLYSGNMVSPYSPTTVVFTPPSPITVSTGVRVYMAIDRGQNISINGTETNASVSAGWNDTGFTGTLTNLTLGPTNAGSSSNPSAIEIDGVILVDGLKGNSWTPVNFGGSVALDNPIVSGALPILNTTQGGTQAGVGVRTDPNYANLVLALPLVSNANDVSNQINSGSTTKVVTVDGAVASSAFSNFYGGSFEFDGTNDDLTIPDSADFNFGADDFTMEMWVYSDASQTKEIMGQRAAGVGGAFSIYHTGANILLYVGSNGSSWDIVAGATIATNVVGQWTHIAIVRNENHFLTFQDGVHVSTTVDDKTVQDSSSPLSIGSNAGTYFFDGKLSDIRIYKGVAKYTNDFVVPSTSPHILPDTPSGVSGGSKLTKITDGAVSFNGTTDYLYSDTSTDFTIAGDFTVEAFVYIRDSAINCFFNVGDYIGSSGFVFYSLATSRALGVYTNNALAASGGEVRVNGWNHVALVRSGTTNTLYLDGKSVATFTNSSTFSGDANIGVDYYNSTRTNYTNGVISNLRYVNGTALYTSNFTPPTAPLTNVTNTKLLCCQSNTSATAAVVAPVNEPFSGAGGAQGGGTTSDYLQVSSSGHSDFSLDGDFTVEWWHYRAAANANNGYMWTIGDSNTNTGLELYWGSSGSTLKLFTNGGENSVTATAATGWHHYAVVRSGNTIKVYYDGTEGASVSNTSTFSGNFTIGGEFYNGSITGGMHGPMSQFRFVKGTAVYTSNFTAPTTALTAITNTKLLTLQGSTITDASGTSKTITVNGTVTAAGISKNGDAAATNFNPFNTDINTVRGQETGYATLNPLINGVSTLSDGNLTSTAPSGSTHGRGRSTITMDTSGTGKFYFEATLTVLGGTYAHFGVIDSVRNSDATYVGDATNCFSYRHDGQKQLEGTASSYGDSYAVGDTIGCSLDCGSGELRFYKNGVDQGVAKTITTQYDACFAVSNFGSSGQWKVNFGQKPFKFPPPDGFQPLNAANTRPVKVISRPDQYVGVMTYMSNNDTLSKNDYKFQPDLLIFKNLDTANHWGWFDSVRGANKQLSSNRPNPEVGTSGVGYGSGTMNSFDPFGFTLGDDVGSNTTNYPADNEHVVYGFKAGGDKNTFNIDDVGYANASDVNMNVGGLNSTLYDQSTVWSDNTTASTSFDSGALVDAFDGDLTTGPLMTGQTTTYVVDLSQDFTDGTIQVYTAGYQKIDVTDDGGTNREIFDGSESGYGWYPATPATFTNIQSVTIKPLGAGPLNSNELRAIKVNGKILVDSNATPPNVPLVAATACSVGTKQGFSIVKYTGTAGETCAHGLTQAPEFIIEKETGQTSAWTVHTTAIDGSLDYLYLNLNNGRADYSIDAPTSTVFDIGRNNECIAYLWHSVPGLQKFGKYVGNGSADGPFVELGFRPAIVMVKYAATTGSANWFIYDSERGKFNPFNDHLMVNENVVEQNNYDIDFLSNGFKLRYADTAGYTNYDADYLYAAWAEAPSIDLYGGGANAR